MSVWHGRHYRQVDVFADRPLGGNGLAVFWDSSDLSAQDMRSLTIELRQFESIFLEKTGSRNVYRARVFTMEEELDFAGHPVLGGAAVLHEKFGTGVVETWTMSMRIGDIRITTESSRGAFQAAMYQHPPAFGATIIRKSSIKDLLRALNLDIKDLHPDLPLEVVSTGLRYLIVPLRASIDKAMITTGNLEEMLRQNGARFIYLYDVERSEGRTWDNKGKFEDIATGSAVGPVAAYLCRHGRLQVGKELVISQGRYAGRPSRMKARVLGTENAMGEVEVSGCVQMVSESILD